jgi:hypothetical protein
MTDPVSIRYTHAKNAYDLMRDEAERKRFDDGTEKLVWEGFLTRLIKDQLGLATPYYSDIKGILDEEKGMGCIKQLRRGGASTKSQWVLLKEPTEESWQKYLEKKPPSRKAIHEQQLADMNKRLTALENALRAGGINV